MIMSWSVIATSTRTRWPTVLIVGEALTVELETLRFATVAWLVLAFSSHGILLHEVLWLIQIYLDHLLIR